ncbi:MAG: ribonucleoside-triphosphate reductase [Candidatus Niyogibacteria bacterium RIFCSPLOWO2_01_FULL_45_48]|uniref:Ribonucleoside-triphosphate reductase n=2 Tax=Candidatus Niyogiibacteriota TaxID=1817912 RepID=A0A1G2F0Y5_9BACT|nr:MAG: ribonucleoside-triphosphate reductase [Candidatus Niyogibacteria bacterium RIFCSPHIGHO2_01_FULL_45_28]OGZ30597.1 MAG: ribonucleoside-triphosphate reductase [Candidatus Niyogibacteria bacterium RIFCSPLOWO2_01_FULL_45_48]OGZ31221.1 MAG: ribonucleoside-triphosphate reductase [Candidatus Niyogibacteria bacterium RIFCSPLOWO2_02_FULL_45_13]
MPPVEARAGGKLAPKIISGPVLKEVRKRDGRVVPFDASRIISAISRAMEAAGEGNLKNDPYRVAESVVKELQKKYSKGGTPGIEDIQDIVESNLILMDFPRVAKAYILYRQKRSEIREKTRKVPSVLKKLVRESKKYFRNSLSEFVYYRSYSRWIEEENRRETWIETVDRYMNFMRENLDDALSPEEYQEIHDAVLRQEVMPSMRLMWSAGEAAKATNVAAYNCSYIAPTKIEDFAEIMYVSMCGAGVGFSIESQTAQQLPQIKKQTGERLPAHIVHDSKEGWCNALTAGLKTWFTGKDVDFDFSKLRPEGARLKTMGGRSSGPGPLRDLMDFTRRKILARQGRRLSNLDVHDIICKIGDIVVSGGVRRSALISLSDFDDIEMRDAKKGQFYIKDPQRSLANNSTVYNEKPSATQFMEEWLALAKSGTGERGIFNRGGLKHQVPARRWKVLKDDEPTWGTNPCGEIILRSKEFCNLTEIVARQEDTEDTLMRKARLATILGTYQSSLTDFPLLSKEWKRNCNEERLLGVSVTGQWDSQAVRDPEVLKKLLAEARRVNKIYAARFGVAPSTAITCVKPSGTVSQLVDASSGMHPRHSEYYIRRIRISATDSLFQMLKDQKVPYKPEVGQASGSANTYVIEFPVKAPKSAKFRDDVSAITQLEHWKMVKQNYTEHNPSVTISVGDGEWIDVAHWLYGNWDILGGLSFLPREETVYQLAPYEAITKERYDEMKKTFPAIDFSQIVLYEKDDTTSGAKELACVSGVCEIQEL